MARTSWLKSDVDADKIFLAAGEKFLSTSLSGEKGAVISLLGRVDRNVTLIGDIIDDLLGDTDKIISLLGDKSISLEGEKTTDPLLGEIKKIIQLIGVDLYSYLDIHMDTSYVTFDYMDITFDRR